MFISSFLFKKRCRFCRLKVKTVICEWLAWAIRMKRPGHDLSLKTLVNKDRDDDGIGGGDEKDARVSSALSIIPTLNRDMREIDHVIHINNTPYRPASERRSQYSPSSVADSQDTAFRSTLKGEISQILEEIRYITNKIKDDMTADEETNDWKWAAMVVDRCCLYIFGIYLVLATAAMFGKAPHIFGDNDEIGLPAS